MKIDNNNQYTIQKNINVVHDAVFTGLIYDYKKRLVSFEAIEGYYKKRFSFKFNNVFGFGMQACDFYHHGANILGWGICDSNNKQLTKKLLHLRDDGKYFDSRIGNINEVVEVVIELNSGDTLTIACEYIEFEEYELTEL